MIRVLLTMLVKALLEVAVVFVAVGVVLAVCSFRLGRRLVTTSDDPLERLSARAFQLNALIPRRAPVPDIVEEDEDEWEDVVDA